MPLPRRQDTEIADAIGVSYKTVATSLRRFSKLTANSDLIRIAVEMNPE
jgi:DNA-binding CsgD family transcriptional regulator